MRKFSFKKAWNDSLNTQQRELVARNYCWGSETGKPLVDRYLAMRGTAPTNPPNKRSLGKFFSGWVWEFIASLTIQQIGIMKQGQEEVWLKDTPIPIKGKLDFKVGGVPDYEYARRTFSSYPFQKEIVDRLLKTVDIFESVFGHDEIEETVVEIKSCSHFVIEKIIAGGNILSHDLQLYFYLKALNIPRGIIVYLSKDDSMVEEREILYPNKTLEDKLIGDMVELKKYLDADEMPPRLPMVTFEEKFTKQFSIEYSNYLTLLYGFLTPDQYADSVKGKIASWNRVLARIKSIEAGEVTKTGKPILLTDKNKQAIEEMQKEGWNAYELAKSAVVTEEEEIIF